MTATASGLSCHPGLMGKKALVGRREVRAREQMELVRRLFQHERGVGRVEDRGLDLAAEHRHRPVVGPGKITYLAEFDAVLLGHEFAIGLGARAAGVKDEGLAVQDLSRSCTRSTRRHRKSAPLPGRKF